MRKAKYTRVTVRAVIEAAGLLYSPTLMDFEVNVREGNSAAETFWDNLLMLLHEHGNRIALEDLRSVRLIAVLPCEQEVQP